ncbi:MAG: Crp/Fnr family transcriptional regulator, partial [Polyangiaceae bacterium]
VRALGRQLVGLLNRRVERTGRPTRQPQRGVWALGGTRLFDGVAKTTLEDLVHGAERRELSKRSSLLLEEQDTRVWVLVSGGIKLCRTSSLGGRLVEAILAPGDLFGRLSTGGTPTPLEVESLEASELAGLHRAAFAKLLSQHPELALSVVQELEDRQQRLVRRLESLVFKDVRARVAETLLELARENHGPCQHGFAVDVRITQQDLAELVGATRQMVNRVLGELSRELYVQRVGKVICVLHLERLERLTSAGTETSE